MWVLWHTSDSKFRSKCKLAPAITSTSQTVTAFTFLEPKPTTSPRRSWGKCTSCWPKRSFKNFCSRDPERGSPADESPRFSSYESLKFKLETLASLAERSEASEETLTGTTGALDVQERAEDSEKNTAEDNRSRCRGTAGYCPGGRRFLLNKLQFASSKWSQSWFCGIPTACVCNRTACYEWFWCAECGRY